MVRKPSILNPNYSKFCIFVWCGQCRIAARFFVDLSRPSNKMNKWKVAFWISLTLLILVTIFATYSFLDQAYTLTYNKVGYEDTEKHLDELIKIINKTDLTKMQIEKELNNHNHFKTMNFNSDTISLNRVLLIFQNDKLKSVKKLW
jgi:hypothetical protein